MCSLFDSLRLLFRKRRFDAAFYCSTYQDVAPSGIEPWEHYRRIGYYQDRRFCSGAAGYVTPHFSWSEKLRLLRRRLKFEPKFYTAEYEDAARSGLSPWRHYCLFGFREQRCYSRRQAQRRQQRMAARAAAAQRAQATAAPRPVRGGRYKRFPLLNTLKALADKLLHRDTPPARIAVILHLFYMNSWAEIYSYIRMLQRYGADFYITYTDTQADAAVLARVQRNLPNAKLIPCPNQGFDVGPFLEVLRTLPLENYDIVYKLQSKGTGRKNLYLYRQIFKKRDWFLNLYRGLFGFRRTAEVIRLLTEKGNGIGLVAADNLIINDPPHKRTFTQQIARERFNLELPADYHFVAGTCFAVRAELLRPVQQWQLNLADFAATRREEFSLAHAMERIVCAVAELQGYSLHGLPTPHPRYAAELRRRQACDSVRLLEDKRFSLDPDFFYKVLEGRCITYYEVVPVKLGNIRRRWVDEKVYPLAACSPFRYLNGDKEAYARYCKENAAHSDFDMSQERFDELIRSLDQGYDAKHMPVLRSDNMIMDGQHRSCILLHRYGPEHSINVLRIYSYIA